MIRNDAEHKFEINTLEGDGKGSKITIALKEIPSGRRCTTGRRWSSGTGFFIKGKAKASFEKVAEEDAKALEAM